MSSRVQGWRPQSARGAEQQCEPAGGAAGVGLTAAASSAVVGHLCHLCQQIYAEEDEGKVVHCSTAATTGSTR